MPKSSCHSACASWFIDFGLRLQIRRQGCNEIGVVSLGICCWAGPMADQRNFEGILGQRWPFPVKSFCFGGHNLQCGDEGSDMAGKSKFQASVMLFCRLLRGCAKELFCRAAFFGPLV